MPKKLYTFYEHKLCKNKEDETGKKWEQIKKFPEWEVFLYVSFENFLTKKWPDIGLLVQFNWGHNQTPKVVSNMQGTAQLLHDMYE